MLKAIAIDDEPFALEVIKSLSEKVPFMELVAAFTNPIEAIGFLKEREIDLLFLDIKMPDISGIELLKKISDPPMTIFTTAYSEHAIKGFELNAIDYLLKPFSSTRFLQACSKANELKELKIQVAAVNDDFIFIKSGYEQVKISLPEILYIQSAGNYVQFVLSDEKLISRLTMSEVEELLREKPFSRIHRSFIVANKHITKMDKNSVFIADVKLPVGPGFRK